MFDVILLIVAALILYRLFGRTTKAVLRLMFSNGRKAFTYVRSLDTKLETQVKRLS